jgi:hypothetical protein
VGDGCALSWLPAAGDAVSTAPVETRLEAALAYAGRGWPVLPVHGIASDGGCTCGKLVCNEIAKHPRITDWTNAATTDEAIIRAWLRQWPRSNIAIATGARSGFVVDIDPAAGGYDSADALQARHGAFPATLAAATGGGGLHLYYRWPEHGIIRNSASKLGAGIDTRGSGGYALVPPSLHRSGNYYTWTGLDDATDLAPAPPWLITLLAEQPAGRTLVARGTAALTDEPIPEGERNATLAQMAGVMRRAGFSEAEILAALTTMNANRCRPSLPDVEVKRIAQSVGRYTPAPQEGQSSSIQLASGAVLRPIRTGTRYGR